MLTSAETAEAKAYIENWFWQIDEMRQYRFEHATKTIVRYYEAASCDARLLRILLEYLSTEVGPAFVLLNNKRHVLDGTWKASGATYRTAPNDNWSNTPSSRIRIYQFLVQAGSDVGDAHVIENGCKYKVTHTYYWDVDALPALPVSSSGIQYTIQGLTRDKETGLFSCVIEKRETVMQQVPLYNRSETVFETRREAQYLGVKRGELENTGLEASVGNGTTVEVDLSKNADCTYNKRNNIRIEKPVADAVKTYKKTLRGVVARTVDRGQATPLSDADMVVGESRQSEKTSGGLYDNMTELVTTEAAGVVAESCQDTIFEHSHETLTNTTDKPDDIEAKDTAEDGKTYSKSTRQNDLGTWDTTERETEEKPVEDAAVEVRKTLRGTSRRETHRNQTTPCTTLAAGETMGVGETRRSDKTPGGLYDNTTDTVTTEAAGVVAESCQDTIFEHTHETVENVLDKPDEEASAAEGGKIYSKTVRQNELGSWDVTGRETEEKPVPDASFTIFNGLRTTTKQTIDRASEEPGTSTPAIGTSVKSVKTPGGRYDVTIDEVKQVDGSVVMQEAKEETQLRSVTTQTKSGIDTQTLTSGVNSDKKIRYNYNEDGVRTETTVETVTHKPKTSGVKSWCDANYDYSQEVYRNQKSPKMPSSGGQSASASFHLNEHGSYDGSWIKKTPRETTDWTTETLQDSHTTTVYAKYYFVDANQEVHFIEFSATLKYFYGRTGRVMRECAEGSNVACVGWHTGFTGNVSFSQGRSYTGIIHGEVDEELPRDDG